MRTSPALLPAGKRAHQLMIFSSRVLPSSPWIVSSDSLSSLS
jgi:hypothetical protein